MFVAGEAPASRWRRLRLSTNAHCRAVVLLGLQKATLWLTTVFFSRFSNTSRVPSSAASDCSESETLHGEDHPEIFRALAFNKDFEFRGLLRKRA